jgi:O-antigen chain-terminating methyltransferase
MNTTDAGPEVSHPDAKDRLKRVDPAQPVPEVPEPRMSAAPAQSEKPVPAVKPSPRITLLKKLERYITAFFKLGRTEVTAKEALRHVQGLEDHVSARLDHMAEAVGHQKLMQADHMAGFQRRLDQEVQDLTGRLEEQNRHLHADLQAEVAAYRSGLAVLSRTITDLTGRLDRLMLAGSRAGEAGISLPSSAPEGLTAFTDQFYHRLENQYRGSREEITGRLRIYLEDVTAAVKHTGGKPVMDLGCGRGEWLEVLGGAGLTAFGIDTNPVQAAEAQERGLDIRIGDGAEALGQAGDASLSVITAHHLIEHLSFDQVAWITREAMRVLAPGGLLLFETPNTRNVLVGATTFHTDPTHLKPMPAQVMSVLLETAGFHPVEVRHINPHERLDEFLAKPDINNELAYLLFGPQDLTVLGHKPLDGG